VFRLIDPIKKMFFFSIYLLQLQGIHQQKKTLTVSEIRVLERHRKHCEIVAKDQIFFATVSQLYRNHCEVGLRNFFRKSSIVKLFTQSLLNSFASLPENVRKSCGKGSQSLSKGVA
jgi:hypothetical protein